MNSIKQLKKKDLAEKCVLVRVDFNVPLKNGRVVEDFRIKQSLPTINYLRKNGAKVILISHLGSDGTASLQPVANYLKKFFPVKFADLADLKTWSERKNGEVILMENLRRNDGEKKNDLTFAKNLASLADLYVNEAFAVSHREQASIVGVPRYLPTYAGLQLMTEIKNLSQLLTPRKPFVVILSGAKFQTKIPLIKKLQKTADQIFIGGALANAFFKAKGYEIGQSICEEKVDYLKPFLKNKKILLPVDVIVKTKDGQKTKFPNEVAKDEMIVDVGPASLNLLEKEIKPAKTILWNGPLGLFENGYKAGTIGVAKILAKSRGDVVVGGGDTLAAVKKIKFKNKKIFISTGGGALVDYLATGNLPGLKALTKQSRH